MTPLADDVEGTVRAGSSAPVPPAHRAAALAAHATELSSVLRSSGIQAALGYLNARTRFRFTGIYRAEPPLLRNVCLFDRENPLLNVSDGTSPLNETYCAVTCAGEAPFATPNAQRDPRLRGHAARDSILSYSGVPLRFANGRVWGTLCHFDVRPRLIPSHEICLLEAVAPVLSAWVMERIGAT